MSLHDDDATTIYALANWSLIMATTGLDPSGRGAMISSTSARRLAASAVTKAFSTTFDANLWRDMCSICPRSRSTILARSSGCPCSSTNWMT